MRLGDGPIGHVYAIRAPHQEDDDATTAHWANTPEKERTVVVGAKFMLKLIVFERGAARTGVGKIKYMMMMIDGGGDIIVENARLEQQIV